MHVEAGVPVAILAGERAAGTFVPPPSGSVSRQSVAGAAVAATANISVVYHGFPPDAQNAFQHAVDIWETLVASTVEIKVEATWEPVERELLGTAGATFFLRDFALAPQPRTMYPVALANKLAGRDLLPNSADIVALVSSEVNWYFGTDGHPPATTFDLVTVAMQQIAFGLGFHTSMTVIDGVGSWGAGRIYPYIYDIFVVNAANASLLTAFPNNSAALAGQLTSNEVYFSGPRAIAARGMKVRLFAPAPWIQGVSGRALDETTYPTGDSNSLMTPYIARGEAIHSLGGVGLGVLHDLGWAMVPHRLVAPGVTRGVR